MRCLLFDRHRTTYQIKSRGPTEKTSHFRAISHTHETESPRPPLHFKHSQWRKRAEPVQVCFFTLRLRGPTEYVREWRDGCKSPHGILHGIEWSVFHGHFNYYQKPPLGGRPNTKPRDHGTPNTHNCWVILFCHV